jgi:hypothetical protein
MTRARRFRPAGRWGRAMTGALLALGVRSTPCTAQSRVEVVPFFASYFPTTPLKDVVDDRDKQTTAAMGGARLRVRIGPTLTAEASVGYTASRIASEQPSGLPAGSLVNTQPGHLWFPSLRLVLQPRRANYMVFAGGGAVLRRGKGWPKRVYPNRDALAGMAGFGVRPQLTRSLDMVFTIELYLYSLDADGGGAPGNYYSSTFQKDLIVSTGIPIGLFGH